MALASPAAAHDLEHTQVALRFARDGSFTLDVSNDPRWLKLRLESIRGTFADRVVLWVDGREVRPATVQFIDGDPLATHRMRGRMPLDARTLRWYYGLVADPYPMTIRRADGRLIVEEIQGDAWSGTIDIGGQFTPAVLSERSIVMIVVGLMIVPLALRIRTARYRWLDVIDGGTNFCRR